MNRSSRSRSLSDEGDITDIGRHSDPHRRRRQVGQKRSVALAKTKKFGRVMKKWLTMCWGGGSSCCSKSELEKAREKEMLLLEDSDDEAIVETGEEVPVIKKKAAYVPQHAAASFLRTATPRRMRRANEVM
jgi:hypothetical protein